MQLQISPWAAIGLNAAYAILTGLTIPVVDALGFSGHDAQIVAWAAIASVPLNMVLHSISSSVPGPLAPPDAAPVAAAQAVVDLPSSAPRIQIEAAKAAAVNAIAAH